MSCLEIREAVSDFWFRSLKRRFSNRFGFVTVDGAACTKQLESEFHPVLPSFPRFYRVFHSLQLRWTSLNSIQSIR